MHLRSDQKRAVILSLYLEQNKFSSISKSTDRIYRSSLGLLSIDPRSVFLFIIVDRATDSSSRYIFFRLLENFFSLCYFFLSENVHLSVGVNVQNIVSECVYVRLYNDVCLCVGGTVVSKLRGLLKYTNTRI